MDAALSGLTESVYSKLHMVNHFAESDADLLAVLNGSEKDNPTLAGTGANNEEALNEVGQWLELQSNKHLSTTMGEVQRRYGAIPYGWREIDIAALVARLAAEQKISIRYGGAIVGRTERRLVDYLRKKSEIDKAVVVRRVVPSEGLMRKSIAFLREYLGVMDVPSDEEGLIAFVTDTLESKQGHYQKLLDEDYAKARYPEKEAVTAARDLMQEILGQRRDNVALLTCIVQKQDDLLDSLEDLEDVEAFFKSQRAVFDSARKQLEALRAERDYFAADPEAQEILKTISEILNLQKPYSRIGELPELISDVKRKYQNLLGPKKDEVNETIRQCMEDVHQLAGEARDARELLRQADSHFLDKRRVVEEAAGLTVLDAMITQLLNYTKTQCKRLESLIVVPEEAPSKSSAKPQKITTLRRHDLCTAKRLRSDEEIDRYVEEIRQKLKTALTGCDGIQIN